MSYRYYLASVMKSSMAICATILFDLLHQAFLYGGEYHLYKGKAFVDVDLPECVYWQHSTIVRTHKDIP